MCAGGFSVFGRVSTAEGVMAELQITLAVGGESIGGESAQ